MKDKKIMRVLTGRNGNYIFPFFWIRGEKEDTIREYMKVIDESNIKAVCIESRPHPDFCGPGWWHDMDIIIEEAKKRNMKVWILDDSHFPTGFANGAMAEKPDMLCRQSICCKKYDRKSGEILHLTEEELKHPEPFVPTQMDMYAGEKNPRKFDDDKLLAIYAVSVEEKQEVDLKPYITGSQLEWEVPKGNWKVYVLHLTRNMGYHRSYINMLSASSCRVQIDAVYEPHYERYKEEFGKTIAGFFSDEPELGNGHIYDRNAKLGMDIDYPWSDELELLLIEKMGEDYARKLYLLWENEDEENLTASIRYIYMDAVTSLVKKDFSQQIGEWCRSHNVQYIGHIIEDNDQHSRTGSSLGHYFRGLSGQDMAGIDDIGAQVFPQGEDITYDKGIIECRDGEFYHYMLGKLAGSSAAIEPLKKGNSMCEIFGGYGWGEGVRLEKYLLDHFMVRGINHFVPHAFSAADYPDPDCPPHFYAHGNNPQYRHFGELMKYANRICELISCGRHIAPVAILYHGEGEWTGDTMYSHKPGRLLCDAQIDYDYIPQDVFRNMEEFQTVIADNVLKVNTQEYRVLLVPKMQFVTKAFAMAVERLVWAGVKVYFLDEYPAGICDASEEEQDRLLSQMRKAEKVPLNDLVKTLKDGQIQDLEIMPLDNRIRYYHYEHEDGMGILMFVNEGIRDYRGTVRFSDRRQIYAYDVWSNRLLEVPYNGESFSLEIEQLKSLMIILDASGDSLKDFLICAEPWNEKKEISFSVSWRRSICKSIEYPYFKEEKQVSVPDTLAEEQPDFSGFVRYENNFCAQDGKEYLLEITDAYEGVEVFVNGKSLGIQVTPVYRYDLSNVVRNGDNEVVIEVATTLERENAKNPTPWGMPPEPTAASGITGTIHLYSRKATR